MKENTNLRFGFSVNQQLEVDLCPQILDQVGCIEIGTQRSGAFLGMVSLVQQTARNSSRLFGLRGTALHCKEAVGST